MWSTIILAFTELCNIKVNKEKLTLLKEYCNAELTRDKEQSFTQSFRVPFTFITPIITFFIGIYAESQDLDTLLVQSIRLIGFILLVEFLRMAFIDISKSLKKKKVALNSLIYDIDQMLIFKTLDN